MMNKRGGLLDEESVKVILAVAVFILMALLILKLFAPNYDEADEIAKSYFERLGNEIELADEKRSAGFFILNDNKKETNFYLVYLGGAMKYDATSSSAEAFFERKSSFFYFGKAKKNVLCICSVKDGVGICKHCDDFGLSAVLTGAKDDVWSVGEGSNLNLEEEGGKYVFSTK